jgi:hypothetical protein
MQTVVMLARNTTAELVSGDAIRIGYEVRRSKSHLRRSQAMVFGLWRVCFPPILIRTDRRLLV